MPRGNCPRCKIKPTHASHGYCKDCARAKEGERRQKRKELFAAGLLKIATEKKCTRCKKTKLAAFFGLQAATKDGLFYWCKACTSESCTKSNKRRKYGMDEEAIIALLRLTPSPNSEPVLVRESSSPMWGLKGFSDEEATQCRADCWLASAG